MAFDRLLARMFDPSQPVRDGWVLKGGYALEMRFHMARSTKDLDLTVRTAQGRSGDSSSLRERLQIASSIERPDFFTFIVGDAMAGLIGADKLLVGPHWRRPFRDSACS